MDKKRGRHKSLQNIDYDNGLGTSMTEDFSKSSIDSANHVEVYSLLHYASSCGDSLIFDFVLK